MAARRLVSSLSRPAKIILLHHLRESPKINSVYRSLLNPTPQNPKHRSPDRLLGSRFPSTPARPFSTNSGSDLEAACRHILGIDDAPVLFHHPNCPWQPPKMGEIKINFCGTMAKNHFDLLRDKTGTIIAVARNSTGDALSATTGPKRCNDEGSRQGFIDLQLYALKAAANLAKELQKTGTHVGPVVYETSNVLVPVFFNTHYWGMARHDKYWMASREKYLRRIMPPVEELEEVGRSCPIYCRSRDRLREEVGRSCPIYCGSRERLGEILPGDFFDFDRWDSDKALSGGCIVMTPYPGT